MYSWARSCCSVDDALVAAGGVTADEEYSTVDAGGGEDSG